MTSARRQCRFSSFGLQQLDYRVMQFPVVNDLNKLVERQIDMILPLQEAQNDYRSSFVSLVCRYRRCLRR